jgi:hypothetical protein
MPVVAVMSVMLPKHDAAVEVVKVGTFVAPVKSTEPMRGMSWVRVQLVFEKLYWSQYAVSCNRGTLLAVTNLTDISSKVNA